MFCAAAKRNGFGCRNSRQLTRLTTVLWLRERREWDEVAMDGSGERDLCSKCLSYTAADEGREVAEKRTHLHEQARALNQSKHPCS